MTESTAPQNVINNIIRMRSDDGVYNASFRCYNGGFYMTVWSRNQEKVPVASFFISNEALTVFIMMLKKVEKATASVTSSLQMDRPENASYDSPVKYVGTMYIERDEGNQIVLSVTSAEHKERIVLPFIFSHTSSIKPEGMLPTRWDKTRIGIAHFVRLLETFVPAAIFHTSVNRIEANPTGGGIPVSSNTGSTGNDISWG